MFWLSSATKNWKIAKKILPGLPRETSPLTNALWFFCFKWFCCELWCSTPQNNYFSRRLRRFTVTRSIFNILQWKSRQTLFKCCIVIWKFFLFSSWNKLRKCRSGVRIISICDVSFVVLLHQQMFMLMSHLWPSLSDPRTWELAAPTINALSSLYLPHSTNLWQSSEEEAMSWWGLRWGPPAPTFWDHCQACLYTCAQSRE